MAKEERRSKEERTGEGMRDLADERGGSEREGAGGDEHVRERQDAGGRGRPPHYKHEDPEVRGNVDRGSDEDLNRRDEQHPPRVEDELADEPGIGP